MSQGDSKGRQESLRQKKRDKGGQEVAGDGATGHSMEAFQFGDIGE